MKTGQEVTHADRVVKGILRNYTRSVPLAKINVAKEIEIFHQECKKEEGYDNIKALFGAFNTAGKGKPPVYAYNEEKLLDALEKGKKIKIFYEEEAKKDLPETKVILEKVEKVLNKFQEIANKTNNKVTESSATEKPRKSVSFSGSAIARAEKQKEAELQEEKTSPRTK